MHLLSILLVAEALLRKESKPTGNRRDAALLQSLTEKASSAADKSLLRSLAAWESKPKGDRRDAALLQSLAQKATSGSADQSLSRSVHADLKAAEASRAGRVSYAKSLALDIECEDMCKKMGSYPSGCQCPGWNGNPASSDAQDGRNCYAKYCTPIAHTDDPCPSNDFVTCVADHSKVPALMQVDWTARITQTTQALSKMSARLLATALALDTECEDMCKAVGAYPGKCNCPGWNGNPATSDGGADSGLGGGRGCYEKYCTPIAHTDDPCPSDDFQQCVADLTKVPAFMQVWAAHTAAARAAMRSMGVEAMSSMEPTGKGQR